MDLNSRLTIDIAELYSSSMIREDHSNSKDSPVLGNNYQHQFIIRKYGSKRIIFILFALKSDKSMYVCINRISYSFSGEQLQQRSGFDKIILI